MSFAHMLADVEKLVLLHDDGLIPRLVVQASTLAHTVSLVRPRFIREPSAACSLTLYLCLREVR
jgi:hypothetical protein